MRQTFLTAAKERKERTGEGFLPVRRSISRKSCCPLTVAQTDASAQRIYANIGQIPGYLVSAPKGQPDSAQGFNPGFGIGKRRALKVALDERGLVEWIHQYRWRSSSGATFRAHLLETLNPGLKPWAESLCPFRAKISQPPT